VDDEIYMSTAKRSYTFKLVAHVCMFIDIIRLRLSLVLELLMVRLLCSYKVAVTDMPRFPPLLLMLIIELLLL